MRCLAVLALACGSYVSALSGQTITLYEHDAYRGESRSFSRPVPDLSALEGWNDRVSSVRVEGRWELCVHADYRRCKVVSGDVESLRSLKLNDEVSSLRPLAGDGASSPTPAAVPAGESASVNGYLEYRIDGALVVEGQRVVVGRGAKFKGKGEARSPHDIPLGYQVEAKGVRRGDGAIVAQRIKAKPNGEQMFEAHVRQATDQLEATYREQGQFLTAAGGQVVSLGKLWSDGPDVRRVRRIVDRLLPPYLAPDDVRVYVIDNPEWNAMAMGNYSIYVFKGLMEDVDDDELALVLGHEIAHASHEHSRKQQKRNMWIQIGSAATAVVLDETLEGGEAQAAGMLAGLGAAAFASGYSRDQEDQADIVGMRYAYEGGFDVSKGPGLWQKFADKYGDQGKVENFFFGDHSRSTARARILEREIRLHYGDGKKR